MGALKYYLNVVTRTIPAQHVDAEYFDTIREDELGIAHYECDASTRGCTIAIDRFQVTK
jgi:hypothetical protein